MNWFWFVLAGVLSGVFGGLGMGGGTVLIPVLTILLGVGQRVAQGINLLSFLLVAIFSAFIHYRNGFIVTKNIWIIIFFGIIFAIFGAIFVQFLPTQIIRILFGVFLCVLAVVEFVKLFEK